MEQTQLMEINEKQDLNYGALTPQEKATVDNYVKTLNVQVSLIHLAFVPLQRYISIPLYNVPSSVDITCQTSLYL
mgnify:CR=1 FL=1